MQTYNKGLEGLVAGKTAISRIDGENGKLWLRGYPIQDIARHCKFEEAAYLVIHGELPTPIELNNWKKGLTIWRNPPEEAFKVLEKLPATAHPLMKYRTMMTVAACYIPEGENARLDAQWQRPPRILSWTASLASASIRHIKDYGPLPPGDGLSFTDNFLWQSLGRMPHPLMSRAFEVSMIVQIEHGLHAAALAAMTVISTGADLGSAVLAGMGALSGKIHGGANQLAFEMLLSLETPDKARQWVKRKLDENYRFPGFGHRIYKAPDPRVTILEPIAEKVLKFSNMNVIWDIYIVVKEEVEKALGSKGIFVNVDGITGLIYHALGFKSDTFSIPFALAIQTGWMAHCLEYIPSGKLIEPGAVYIGD